AEGRSRAWVNGSPVTITLLGEIGSLLVDLHGQHEHQSLMRREEQRVILDAFTGMSEITVQVAAAYADLGGVAAEIQSLEERRREARQRADFLRFQAAEIE